MSQKKPLWPALKRLLSYGKVHRGTMSVAIVMLWVAAAAEVSGPLLIVILLTTWWLRNRSSCR